MANVPKGETRSRVGTRELCRKLAVSDRTVRRWHAAGYIQPAVVQNNTLYQWDLRDVLRGLKKSGRFSTLTVTELLAR